MGFLGKTIEGTYVLVSSTCYGVLFSLGMLGTIVGSVILSSDVPLPTSGPTMFVFGGILLMLVNSFALLALWHRRWQWLLISEGIFAFLLVVIYATAIVAICLALEMESPVAEAIDRAWKQGIAFRREMHTSWCLDSNSYDELIACERWKDQMNLQLLNPALDADACPFTRLQVIANCSLIHPDHNALQAQACAPAATDAERAQLHSNCQSCDDICREMFIASVADDLYPVSVMAYIMCFFVAVTAAWNSFVVLAHATRTDTEGKRVAAPIDGMWALVSYMLNGTVCMGGALMLVIGLLLTSNANEDCREHAGAAADLECAEPSLAFVAMIVLGICLAVCALISTIGVQKTATMNAKFVWINLLRITQVVYTIAGMLMLACAIIFSLSSGALGTVNSEYIGRFEGVREHLDNANPSYCRYQQGSAMEGYDPDEGSSWRSKCSDRIDCTAAEMANRNCAWDEEMYDAIHTADSPVEECSTVLKPVKDSSSQCKYLANMLAGVDWTELAQSFANADPGGRQQLAQASCAAAVQQTFDRYGRCPYAANPLLGEAQDDFDCRRCFANQEFSGTGDAALCDDNDLEIEMMFQSTAMSCEVMAGAGMCHFPVRVFNTFLDGTTEGFRKIYEICGCSCRGNNEDIYDSGGVNSTCVDIIPLRANNDGNEHALLVSATGEALLDPNNLAGSRIRLGTHVDCELFTDPENQCGMTLREATGDDPLNNPVLRADVSEGAKDLKVSEWCRDLCCGRHNVTFVEDAGCGECRSESLVLTRNVTSPVDAETLCFLDVVAYVRADTDASATCREAVKDSYAGNEGKAVRDAICRMTDYDCRNRIKHDTAENMAIVAIVALVIVGFIVGTMFFTLRTMYLFRPPVETGKKPNSTKNRDRDMFETANPAASRESMMVNAPAFGDET